MRDIVHLHGLLAAARSMGHTIAARQRSKRAARALRPQITPLRLLHPDEVKPQKDFKKAG